jgi:hypothetical protein
MSRSAFLQQARPLALAVLAGATTVGSTAFFAAPALAAPVTIASYTTQVAEGASETSREQYLKLVKLPNGATAYGIDQDQPVAPSNALVFDDDEYRTAEPFVDPKSGQQAVLGEAADDTPVYWWASDAALVGYILSVFGDTDDPAEARAVQWAVHSLKATSSLREPSTVMPGDIERAKSMIQDARNTVPRLTQKSYDTGIVVDATGRPTHLSIQMPEQLYEMTITLEGPVTFADGSQTMTFTGGAHEQKLELLVANGVTGGDFTATLMATMPSTELTVLPDDEYRDMLIAGQIRTVTWSDSATFKIGKPVDSVSGTPDKEKSAPGTGVGIDTSVQDGAGDGVDGSEAAGPGAGDGVDGSEAAGPGAGDGVDGSEAAGPGAGDGVDGSEAAGPPVDGNADKDPWKTPTIVEAFVLFQTETHTWTETSMLTQNNNVVGSSVIDHSIFSTFDDSAATGVDGLAYAAPVMADTGMGGTQTTAARSMAVPLILGLVSSASALGAWLLVRRGRTPSKAALR